MRLWLGLRFEVNVFRGTGFKGGTGRRDFSRGISGNEYHIEVPPNMFDYIFYSSVSKLNQSKPIQNMMPQISTMILPF